ncbi:MAG: hypothetical protein HY747_09400 [Elusimicrobia bacterium]|nr:hypothetical protein [Elusimicrobiota bacterium]
MPKKKFGKPKAPPLKEQVAKIAFGVVKIQETLDKTLPTLATKVELAEVKHRVGQVEERLGGVEQRLGGVEQRLGGVEQRLEGKADKNDINALNEHLTGLLKRSMEIHNKKHDKIEERLAVLDRPQEGQIAKLEQKVFSAT